MLIPRIEKEQVRTLQNACSNSSCSVYIICVSQDIGSLIAHVNVKIQAWCHKA